MHVQSIQQQTRAIYERHAAEWDAERRRDLFERVWLDRLLAVTSAGDTVLDVGCGAGDPIARYFIDHQRNVCGVDFAEPMLARARARIPEMRWVHADMRDLDLGETFKAVIAWDSFFHLTADEQRVALPRLARHVAHGGALLVTVGPSAGEAIGSVGGEAIYHASLSIEEYTQLLHGEGLQLASFVPEDPGCSGRSLLLAQRTSTDGSGRSLIA